jgi:hypothetical protein
MTQITLTVEKQTEDGIVSKGEVVNIKKLNFRKFIGVSKTVKDIIETVKKDETLVEVFRQMFVGAPDLENETPEEKAERDAEFMGKLVLAFQTLAVEVPEKAIELLGQLSGIDVDVLMDQDFEVVLNVYDAVIEVNNVPDLIERVKKSSELTKSAMKLKQLVQNVNSK